jgi:hypothetical protein
MSKPRPVGCEGSSGRGERERFLTLGQLVSGDIVTPVPTWEQSQVYELRFRGITVAAPRPLFWLAQGTIPRLGNLNILRKPNEPVATIVLPKALVTFSKPTTYRVVFTVGGVEAEVLSKKVMLAGEPTSASASPPPS